MIFGFDISTSIIGVAVFKNDGNFVEVAHCDLRKEDLDIISKGKVFDGFLDELFFRYDVCGREETHVFIEDRLGGFSAGKTMMQTLMKLAAFNGVASWIISEQLSKDSCLKTFEHIHPSTAKAVCGLKVPKGEDKKKLTVEFVRGREGDRFPVELNRNGGIKPFTFDQADAYLIALAGYRKFLCTKNESSKLSVDASVTKPSRKATKRSSPVLEPSVAKTERSSP